MDYLGLWFFSLQNPGHKKKRVGCYLPWLLLAWGALSHQTADRCCLGPKGSHILLQRCWFCSRFFFCFVFGLTLGGTWLFNPEPLSPVLSLGISSAGGRSQGFLCPGFVPRSDFELFEERNVSKSHSPEPTYACRAGLQEILIPSYWLSWNGCLESGNEQGRWAESKKGPNFFTCFPWTHFISPQVWKVTTITPFNK